MRVVGGVSLLASALCRLLGRRHAADAAFHVAHACAQIVQAPPADGKPPPLNVTNRKERGWTS